MELSKIIALGAVIRRFFSDRKLFKSCIDRRLSFLQRPLTWSDNIPRPKLAIAHQHHRLVKLIFMEHVSCSREISSHISIHHRYRLISTYLSILLAFLFFRICAMGIMFLRIASWRKKNSKESPCVWNGWRWIFKSLTCVSLPEIDRWKKTICNQNSWMKGAPKTTYIRTRQLLHYNKTWQSAPCKCIVQCADSFLLLVCGVKEIFLISVSSSFFAGRTFLSFISISIYLYVYFNGRALHSKWYKYQWQRRLLIVLVS